MPSQDIGWLPDDDVVAIISYMRSVPNAGRPDGSTEIRTFGKVLDRREQVVLDVARRIDHSKVEQVPAKTPTPAYGAFLSRQCAGCHGERLSGGPIPGAPSSIPVPRNLTPDPTGLANWTFEDFDSVMRTAVRKDGSKLDPFMPIEAWSHFDDVEMHALWAYLRTLAPTPFGNRLQGHAFIPGDPRRQLDQPPPRAL
jgi:mono/diheme cytochrome c family protein